MQRPPILDPRAVPVTGADSDLLAIDPARLTAGALRARFLAQPAWQVEFPGDGRLIDREPAAASVLLPLVTRERGLTLLLTLRTDHLHDHAGQISFPGGRSEPQDASAADTALREAEEEVGLAREHVELIGELPTYTTVTNFVVTPVVALVSPGFTLRPDPFEVAEVFEVPLDFLMNPAHHRRHAFESPVGRREFLSMPWRRVAEAGEAGQSTEAREYFIWGATAAMLRNLYRFLAA
ncbi:MAG TPA: CoA pyrophosphatase [Methylibium sp.]|uniref:NUDIX hydrolase n=1 Tax=Methylibium sp. TaxID=2067992 RepID=UPI002DBE4607|nr:CoA pyrophosphatase [Methylibium sp.]HEU4458167.1 CoA pyrophosphatase [Methylibium sp.]